MRTEDTESVDEDAALTDEEFEDLNAAEQEAEAVTYSGTDFDVEGLVRRLGRNDIVIPTFGHGDPSLERVSRGIGW